MTFYSISGTPGLLLLFYRKPRITQAQRCIQTGRLTNQRSRPQPTIALGSLPCSVKLVSGDPNEPYCAVLSIVRDCGHACGSCPGSCCSWSVRRLLSSITNTYEFRRGRRPARNRLRKSPNGGNSDALRH